MSPKRIAKLLAAVGIAALGAILIITIAVVHKRKPTRNLSQVADLLPNSLLHVRHFHWTQMKGSEKQWILNAAEASYAKNKKSIILRDAKLTMLTNDGKQVELDAPAVKLALNGDHVQRAFMSGGITVHYGDLMLATEQATFLPDSDQLTAPGLVTVVGKGLKIVGTGLTGHPNKRQFTLNKQVSTEVTPRSGSASTL